MDNELIEKAAAEFSGPGDYAITPLGNGLIHQTFRVSDKNKSFVLQAINTAVFKKPQDILHNYLKVYHYLQHQNISIPEPLFAKNGQSLWIDGQNNYWRATAFINDSFSPSIASTPEDAYTVAKSFASFTRSLSGMDMRELKEIIPKFHDLAFRYAQFEKAIQDAPSVRLLKSTHVISELRNRKKWADWYESIRSHAAYPERVMHHDCKISNILFNQKSHQVICPVDLDTLMPGKFISDLGDMIRSMSCTVDENSTRWEEININPYYYESVLNGYLEGIGDIFTKEERKNIHCPGLIMIYMQSIRFLTDFLNGDVYYKTNYPEQNLNRALNQLILLEKLEDHIRDKYSFSL